MCEKSNQSTRDATWCVAVRAGPDGRRPARAWRSPGVRVTGAVRVTATDERVRAVVLAALMVFSVFAGVGPVGTAAGATAGNVSLGINGAGDTATVTVDDPDLNTDSGSTQAVTVNVDSDSETPAVTEQTSSDTPDGGTQTYTVSPGGLVADRNNDNTIDKADFTLGGASDESITDVSLNGNGNYEVTIADSGAPDDANPEFITYTKLQGAGTGSDTSDGTTTQVTTSAPVGDRNGDGVVDVNDIDLVKSSSDEAITGVSINSDGTATVTIGDSGGTADGSEAGGASPEQFTYLPTETVTLTETGDDTGTFTGSISIDQSDNNGVLYAEDGDLLTTAYWDSGTKRTDTATLSLSDTTAPAISNVGLSEASGDMVITFDSDESLGTSASDVSVAVSGPNGASYTFDRTQFTESGSGPYTYTIAVQQAYDDGDGTYTASVDDAKDAAGNNGGNNGEGSGLTDTYSYSSGGGDTTAPTISDVYLGERNGDLFVSFDSTEQLGSSSGDVAVTVDSPNTGTDWQTFDRLDFSETQNSDGSYTYTLSTSKAYDDGQGTYTATVDDARDGAGNNGGENGDGSGLSTSHDTGDTTAPTVSSPSFSESSGTFDISFSTDEQLGRASGDVTVSVTGPNGATYTYGPSDFGESVSGGTYTYTLSTSQSFDDGQGTYTVTVDDAADPAGNDGGNSGEGSGLSTTHDFSDTTAPTITSVSLSQSSGRMKISFVSDEKLGSGGTDVRVSVAEPDGTSDWKAFYRHDFTVTQTQNGNYKYTVTQNGFDSGAGTYTLTVDDARDGVGNNGGVDGEGSGLTDTYSHSPGAGTPEIVSQDVEYVDGSAKFQNDAEVEKNIHVSTNLGTNEFTFRLFVDGDHRSASDQKRDLSHSAVGFDETTEIRVRFTVTNYSPDITMGPANVSSLQVNDKSGSKKEIVVTLHPATVQRNFNAPYVPSQWDSSNQNYQTSWEQAQVGVDAMVHLQMASLPPGISKLEGARLNTNAQAFTVPSVSNGQLVFGVAAPHCKVGAKTDPSDPAAADECNEQYVNSDGFYKAVVPKAFWEDQWGSDLDPSNISLVYDLGGSSETLTNIKVEKLNDGDLYIEAKGFHYSSGDIKTLEDTTDPTADAGSDVSTTVGSSVSFDGTSSTDSQTSVTTYEWDLDGDGTFETTGAKPSYSYSSPGTYTVSLKVTDAGSNTAIDAITVTVTDSSGPTASVGSDKTVTVGTEVTFDGSGSTDNVGVSSYKWDFDGDGTTDAIGKTPSYTFSTTGSYDVTLTVTDGAGQTDTATRTITVTDSDVPTASVKPDTTVTAGESVSFDGSGSSDNVGISSYEWDFDGDGTTDATGARAAHTYTEPGTYEATLTVSDAGGNSDTGTRTITVQAADDGTSGPPVEVVDTGSQTNVVVRSHSGGVSVDLAQAGGDTADITADRIAFDTTEPSTFTLNVSTPQTAADAGVPEPAGTDVGDLVGYVRVDHSVGDEKLSNVKLNVTVDWTVLDDGPNGDELVIYRYHDDEWQALDTKVDGYTDRGVTLTGHSPGLSVFVVGTEREPAFALGDAAVDATTVTPGDEVTVTAPVVNNGTAIGETELTLRADGQVLAVETVRLLPGQSMTVEFPTTFDEPGEYDLAVDGRTAGTVTVEGATTATATPGATATPAGTASGAATESTPTATTGTGATATPDGTPRPDGTPTPDASTSSGGNGPGFGALVALLAVVLRALAAARRRG